MYEFMEAQSRIFSATFFGRLVRRVPVFVAVLSLFVFFAVAPFAKVPLPRVPAFIPIYESVLIVSDLITSVLLFFHGNHCDRAHADLSRCFLGDRPAGCRAAKYSVDLHVLARRVSDFRDCVCAAQGS